MSRATYISDALCSIHVHTMVEAKIHIFRIHSSFNCTIAYSKIIFERSFFLAFSSGTQLIDAAFSVHVEAVLESVAQMQVLSFTLIDLDL